MNSRATLLLLLAVWCVALQYVAADDADENPCDQPIIPGKITKYCDVISSHYGYDKASNSCVSFLDTGCPANNNNFRSKAACEEACVN